MININNQLRKYFIYITLISVIFITIVSNIGINYFFKSYIEKSRLRNDLYLVDYVQNEYNNSQILNNELFLNVRYYARSEGVRIIFKNMDTELLFDTGFPMMLGNGMGMRRGIQNSKYSQLESIVYKSYPLFHQNNQIGIIEIGRPSSVLLTSEDVNFIYTMNGIYFVAFIFSIFISIIISSYVSKKFLKPLLLVNNNVSLIADEKYNQILKVDTNTAELHDLSIAIENLATHIQNQEKLRKRLTSDIAHELRTPLATLQSHIEAFIDGVWEPSPDKLSGCYDEVIRLTKLIHNLSDLSSIESDEIVLNKQDVNLSDLLSDVVDNFEPLGFGNDIAIVKDIKPNIHFQGDIDRLNQIFVNLMSNAYKYTNKGGEITAKLYSDDNKIIIVIQDTGIGIAQEDIPYIFERFYRGDTSRSRKTGGTGIGLTITKALVDAHDGTISVESELGKGTSFIIHLTNKS